MTIDLKYKFNDEVWKLIELGVTPSADLISKAGMTESDVSLAVAAVKAQQAKKGTSSGGGSGKSGSSGYTGTKTKVTTDDDDDVYTGNGTPKTSESGNYQEVANACAELASTKDKWAAAAYAREALDGEIITRDEYNELLKKYNPMLDVTLDTFSP